MFASVLWPFVVPVTVVLPQRSGTAAMFAAICLSRWVAWDGSVASKAPVRDGTGVCPRVLSCSVAWDSLQARVRGGTGVCLCVLPRSVA